MFWSNEIFNFMTEKVLKKELSKQQCWLYQGGYSLQCNYIRDMDNLIIFDFGDIKIKLTIHDLFIKEGNLMVSQFKND